MKSSLTKLGLIFIINFLISACSNTSKDKNAQLAELRAKQDELKTEIQKLEDSLSKTDSSNIDVRKEKLVGLITAKQHKFDYFIQTQGRLDAVDDILVGAQVGGLLSEVLVSEGGKVNKGQTLAKVDNEVVIKSRDELLSSLELAKTMFQRQQNLWEQKIGTEVQYLQAKNTKESLENKLATLNEQIEMYVIKSPIQGSIDAVNVKKGQTIMPGLPAFRIVSTDKLKVKADVSEAFITSVKLGNKVYLNFFELQKEFEAKVTFVGKSINSLSRTFQVEAELKSYSHELRINMGCSLKIVFNTFENAITVPVNAIQEINKQKFVFVAQANGKQYVAKKKIVEVLGVYGDEAHINGIEAGENVVTIGQQGLNEGELINRL